VTPILSAISTGFDNATVQLSALRHDFQLGQPDLELIKEKFESLKTILGMDVYQDLLGSSFARRKLSNMEIPEEMRRRLENDDAEYVSGMNAKSLLEMVTILSEMFPMEESASDKQFCSKMLALLYSIFCVVSSDLESIRSAE
jgi:hypothetical protein